MESPLNRTMFDDEIPQKMYGLPLEQDDFTQTKMYREK
jgi:hypothetical protein